MGAVKSRLGGFNPSKGETPEDAVGESEGPMEFKGEPENGQLRDYVVLEETRDDDDEPWYRVIGRVSARNSTAAWRRVLRKEALESHEEEIARVIVVVTGRTFQPTRRTARADGVRFG